MRSNTKRPTNIPPRKRHLLLKKYDFKCVNCGRSNDEVPLEIDHIIPLSKGGTNEESNLQILCCECNMKKSNLKNEPDNKIKKSIKLLEPLEKLEIVEKILIKYLNFSWSRVKILLNFEKEILILGINNSELRSIFEELKRPPEKNKEEKDRKIKSVNMGKLMVLDWLNKNNFLHRGWQKALASEEGVTPEAISQRLKYWSERGINLHPSLSSPETPQSQTEDKSQ